MSKGQNSIFSEHGHVTYPIKENKKTATWKQIFCPQTPLAPLLTPGMGKIGQNSTFSEHGQVTYQIKQNQECSNMVANISPIDPPDPWNGGNMS